MKQGAYNVLEFLNKSVEHCAFMGNEFILQIVDVQNNALFSSYDFLPLRY